MAKQTGIIAKIALICLFFILSSNALSQNDDLSGDEPQEEASTWNVEQMPFNYQNKQVPRELLDVIKKVLKKDGASEAIISDFSLIPVNMQVDIMAETKNRKILYQNLNHRLTYLEGGGEVDFLNFVSGKGPFFVRMQPDFREAGDFHLLYISESPGKDVGGTQWGNKCGRIYNLTKEKAQFIEGNGMGVTSSRKHNLHLLAGTFVFFQLVEDRLYMGYIRLTDSRYPQFKCREA